MADQLQRLLILPGDDPDIGVLLDGAKQVPFLAVQFHDQGGLGQARSDGGGDVVAGHTARERQGLAVGQGHGHGSGARRRHWQLQGKNRAGPLAEPPCPVKLSGLRALFWGAGRQIFVA